MKRVVSVSLVFLLVFLFGCTEISRYLRMPNERHSSRIHSLGMQVYNMSGEEFTESDWETRLYLIEGAFVTLKKCLNLHNAEVEEWMRGRGIVILPPQKIEFFGGGQKAYTNLKNIFIRHDRFDMATLRHEWIHIYLWAANKRIFGDPFHRDALFYRCEYIRNEQ